MELRVHIVGRGQHVAQDLQFVLVERSHTQTLAHALVGSAGFEVGVDLGRQTDHRFSTVFIAVAQAEESLSQKTGDDRLDAVTGGFVGILGNLGDGEGLQTHAGLVTELIGIFLLAIRPPLGGLFLAVGGVEEIHGVAEEVLVTLGEVVGHLVIGGHHVLVGLAGAGHDVEVGPQLDGTGGDVGVQAPALEGREHGLEDHPAQRSPVGFLLGFTQTTVAPVHGV